MSSSLRRGPWSPTEDQRLLELIEVHGPSNWVRISQLLVTRTPKQCRERYHQNLKPGLNHSPITDEEGAYIEQLVQRHGKKWAEIARHLNGRSDNAVKNWWNGGANRRRRNSLDKTLTIPDLHESKDGPNDVGDDAVEEDLDHDRSVNVNVQQIHHQHHHHHHQANQATPVNQQHMHYVYPQYSSQYSTHTDPSYHATYAHRVSLPNIYSGYSHVVPGQVPPAAVPIHHDPQQQQQQQQQHHHHNPLQQQQQPVYMYQEYQSYPNMASSGAPTSNMVSSMTYSSNNSSSSNSAPVPIPVSVTQSAPGPAPSSQGAVVFNSAYTNDSSGFRKSSTAASFTPVDPRSPHPTANMVPQQPQQQSSSGATLSPFGSLNSFSFGASGSSQLSVTTTNPAPTTTTATSTNTNTSSPGPVRSPFPRKRLNLHDDSPYTRRMSASALGGVGGGGSSSRASSISGISSSDNEDPLSAPFSSLSKYSLSNSGSNSRRGSHVVPDSSSLGSRRSSHVPLEPSSRRGSYALLDSGSRRGSHVVGDSQLSSSSPASNTPLVPPMFHRHSVSGYPTNSGNGGVTATQTLPSIHDAPPPPTPAANNPFGNYALAPVSSDGNSSLNHSVDPHDPVAPHDSAPATSSAPNDTNTNHTVTSSETKITSSQLEPTFQKFQKPFENHNLEHSSQRDPRQDPINGNDHGNDQGNEHSNDHKNDSEKPNPGYEPEWKSEKSEPDSKIRISNLLSSV